MIMIHTSLPKRKKQKPTAKQRELKASWEELLKKFVPKNVTPKQGALSIVPTAYRRETEYCPSLGSTVGAGTKKETQHYTGSSIVGIATLHKSNAVPVFSQQDAIDISKMRR